MKIQKGLFSQFPNCSEETKEMGCGSIAEVRSVPDGSLGKVSSCGSIANGLLALGLFLAECVTASGGSDVNDFTQRNADMFFHRNYFDLYVLLTVLRLV